MSHKKVPLHKGLPDHKRNPAIVVLIVLFLLCIMLGALATSHFALAATANPHSPDQTLIALDALEPRLATLPTATAGMMAEFIGGDTGNVYLLGGYQASASADTLLLSKTVLRYDPLHDKMNQLGDLPSALALAAHVYVPEQGLIYLFGGVVELGGVLIPSDAIRTYNVNTGELKTLPATVYDVVSRASAVYVRSLNQIFVFGGVEGTQAFSTPRTTVFRYNLTTGVGDTVATMPDLGDPEMVWVSAQAVAVPYPAVLHPESSDKVNVLASNYILVLGSKGYALFNPATNSFLTSQLSLDVNDIVGAASAFVPGKLQLWSLGGYGARGADVRCWKTGVYAINPTQPLPVGEEGHRAIGDIPLTEVGSGAGSGIDGTQNDASAVYIPTLDRMLVFGGFMAPTTADSDLYCGENRWPDRPAAATYSRNIYSVSPEYTISPPSAADYQLSLTQIINPVVGNDVSISLQNQFGENFAVAIQAAYQVAGKVDSAEMRIVKTFLSPPQGLNTETIPIPTDISPGPEQPDRAPLLRGKQVIGICLLSLTRTSLPPNCREVAVTLQPGALQGIITRDLSGIGQSGNVPVAGAVVELRDGDDDLVVTMTTTADGAYSFCTTGQFCLAVGKYTLNLSKSYHPNEFATLVDRLIHLPRAIAVDVLAGQATTANVAMQVTKVLGPTVRTFHAEHNALLGDEVGTFFAFDHLKGKAGVPAIPEVLNTFTIQTEDFSGDDGLDHPEFHTAKVTFELNGVTQEQTTATAGEWSATFDMSTVLHTGDNLLRITAFDSQLPEPSKTTREITIKAIAGKPTEGQVISYVNLFSIDWSAAQETYTTRILVPKGFRWPDNPPQELDLILLKLYSQLRADIEIHEEYNIAGGWNAEGDGAIRVQLLSLKPDEFQLNDEFTVTPNYNASGVESYTVRSQRFDLCQLKLPKCGEWIPIYGKEFSKEFSSGPASLTLTLNLSLSAQYAASLVLQGTLNGDNWKLTEIRVIPRMELGLKATGEATATGEFEMPAFIPDISFTVSAGAEVEARLFYDQPIVYNPQRSSPVYLDHPCIRLLARAQAWLDLPSPVPDLNTGWWDFVDKDWPDNCFVDDLAGNRSANQLWAASAAAAPPTVMPAPVIAIAPDRHATMRLWIESTTDGPGQTLTSLTYQVQNEGQATPTVGTVIPSGAIADPALTWVSNDKALAVWSQFDLATINANTNLATLFKSQEIYAAFWQAESGWSAPTKLTNNTIGDGRPVLAAHAESGKALVAWVRDPDATAGTAGDLQIMARSWDGTAWGAESLMTQNNQSANTEPALAYSTDGSQAWLLWVRDHDANFNSNQDRKLNYAIWNGTQWAAPVEPANWPTGAFSPDLIFSPLSDKPLVTMVARGQLLNADQGIDMGAAGIGNENRLYAAWWGSAASDWDVAAVGDTRAERPQAMLVSSDRGLILLRDFGGGSANGLPSGAGQVGAAEGELRPDGARWAPPGVLTHSDTPIWQVTGSSIPLNSPSDANFGLNFVAVAENSNLGVNAAQALTPGAAAAIETVGLVKAINLGGTTATGVFELQPATNGVDVAIDDVKVSNMMPVPGEVVSLTVRVRSTTLRPMSEAGNTRVPLFLYVAGSISDAYDDLQEYDGELLFNESTLFTMTYRSAGRPETVRLRLDYRGDLNRDNDEYFVKVGALPGPQAVQVLEGQVIQGRQLQASKVSLIWSPPTLEAGRFWSYRIYRGATEAGEWRLIGYSSNPSFIDSAPASDQLYYAIEAYDEYSRQSEKSVVTIARFLPTAMADSMAVAHETPTVIDVLQNDSDKDGDPLTVSAIGQPQHGTLINDRSSLRYTPQTGYVGSDSFTYTVSDGKEGTAQGAVTLQVLQSPPALSINDVTINESSGRVTFTVSANRTLDVNMEAAAISSNGSASQPGDYIAISTTVSIKNGSISAVIVVPITRDQLAEGDETFTLSLSQPVNAMLADSQGIATIIDGADGANKKVYLPLVNR